MAAENLAAAVAERVEGLLVLLPMHFGMRGHHASFPVALSLSTERLWKTDIYNRPARAGPNNRTPKSIRKREYQRGLASAAAEEKKKEERVVQS